MNGPTAAALLVGLLLLAGCTTSTPPPPAQEPDLTDLPTIHLVDDDPTRAFEPRIAVDPLDSERWLVASTIFHDNKDTGVPLFIRSHVSADAGRTWASVDHPDDATAGHALEPYTYSGDPGVAFASDGTAYLVGMFATIEGERGGDEPPPPFRPFDIVLLRSTDGGQTWPQGTVVAEGTGLMGPTPAGIVLVGTWPDQPFIAAGLDGRMLLTWHVRSATSSSDETREVWYTTSEDHGTNWSTPQPLAPAGPSHTARPAIDNGRYLLQYRDMEEPRNLYVAESDDGQTWDIQEIPGTATNWFTDFAAADGHRWIAVIPDGTFAEEDLYVLHSSPGSPWSRIDVSTHEGYGHRIPSIAAHGSDAIVTYYHARADGTTDYLATDLRPGEAGKTIMLNPEPYGVRDDTGMAWPIYGEYQGLTATSEGFVAGWVGGVDPELDVFATAIPRDR